MLELAKAILRAIEIQELSWDTKAKKYKYNLAECAKRTTDDFNMRPLIVLILHTFWNDAQEWARETIINIEAVGGVKLAARNTQEARAEIAFRWPNKSVAFKGYDKNGECVYMSMVRKKGEKFAVATATKNRGPKPVNFVADVKE